MVTLRFNKTETSKKGLTRGTCLCILNILFHVSTEVSMGEHNTTILGVSVMCLALCKSTVKGHKTTACLHIIRATFIETGGLKET